MVTQTEQPGVLGQSFVYMGGNGGELSELKKIKYFHYLTIRDLFFHKSYLVHN